LANRIRPKTQLEKNLAARFDSIDLRLSEMAGLLVGYRCEEVAFCIVKTSPFVGYIS
jgi:hypothetical protein